MTNSYQIRQTLRGRDGSKCRGCGVEMSFRKRKFGEQLQPKDVTIDHVVPVSRGGTDDASNLRLLCHYCNNSRGNTPIDKETLVLKLGRLVFHFDVAPQTTTFRIYLEPKGKGA